MLYVLCFLFYLFSFAGYINGSLDFKNSEIAINEVLNNQIRFYDEELVFKSEEVPTVSSCEARYSFDKPYNSFFQFDILRTCTNYIIFQADSREAVNDEFKKHQIINSKIRFASNIFTTANIGIYNLQMKKRISYTLNHPHCFQAIESVGDKYLDQNSVIFLIVEYPKVMKNHFLIFSKLKNFSFLTPEIAKILFENRNHLLTPFSLKSLIQTINLDVLISLLELWDYELKESDARIVFDFWGANFEFLDRIRKNPLSWLFYKKLNLNQNFPIDLLKTKFKFKDKIFLYANLLLALLHQTEFVIYESFKYLERMSNYDFMQDNESQLFIHKICDQFTLKNQIVDLLNCINEKEENFNRAESELENINLFFNNFIILFKVPLHSLNRFSVILTNSNIPRHHLKSPMYQSAAVYISGLISQNQGFTNSVKLWTLLKFKIKNLSCSFYDIDLSNEFIDSKSLINLLLDMNFVTDEKQLRRTFWHIPVTIMAFHQSNLNFYSDQSSIDFFLNSLEYFLENQSFESYSMKFNTKYFCFSSEILCNCFYILDYNSELFKVSPESLSSSQIKLLLENDKSRNFMLSNLKNVQKLTFLTDFSARDLLEFFPIGSENYLESHKALITANPEALIGYLRGVQGILNYPEKFIWSVNPKIWSNPDFVDLIVDSIPFSTFVKFPDEAETLFLASSICDIMGRIQRNNGGFQDIKKLIIKWIIQMEWIFNQFNLTKVSDKHQMNHIENCYKKILDLERIARENLILWLKSDWIWSDLLKIVETLPLSYARLSSCYLIYLNDCLATVSDIYFFPVLNSLPYQFSSFLGNNLAQVNILNLERIVTEHVEILRGFINLYFDPVEKAVWKNRLKIINLLSISKVDLHSKVSSSYIHFLFREAGIPVHDTQIAADVFDYLGFGSYSDFNLKGKFLEPSAELSQIIKINAEMYDASINNILKNLQNKYL